MGRRALAWVLVGGLAIVAHAADPPPAPVVKLDGDRITIKAGEMRPRALLEAVAVQAEATLVGGVLHDDPVTIEAESEPLENVLRRVLRDQNFLVRYRRDGRPSGIELIGGPRTAPPAAPVVVVSSQGTTSTTIPRWGIPRPLGSKRELRLPEPLADRLGAEAVTLDEIVDVSLGYEDGSTRLLSHQIAMDAFLKDRRSRRRFFDALRRNPPDERALASEDGAKLLEMLDYMAVHSREPSLQHKAQVVLDGLRGSEPE